MQSQSVLLISSNSSARGGGERYLIFLAQGLLDLNFQVAVLLSDLNYMDGWAAEFEALGVNVYRLPLKSLAQRPLRFLTALYDNKQIEAISRFCKFLRPSAILVNQQYDEDGLDYLEGALSMADVPVASVMHMPMTSGKNQRPLGRFRGALLRYWYKRHYHRYRLIFVSEGAQAEFEAYYSQPRPTYVVNNAVPISFSTSDEPAPLFFGDTPVIGYVGQFVQQKNLACLIEAWRMLAQRGIETHLLLVGDGPDRQYLEQRLIEVGRPGTWLIIGWTSQPEALLQGMDIFVMSSHFEGLPLSLIEAAARGITCVVTPFNGASDVAKHAPWVHVADGHSETVLVDVLEKILSSGSAGVPIPPNELESFRAHFSIRRMATEVVSILGLSPCTS